MGYLTINDAQFNQALTLREAYRIMERFASDYLKRGDTSISDFLHVYAAEVGAGQTTDPAAVTDFLSAANSILVR